MPSEPPITIGDELEDLVCKKVRHLPLRALKSSSGDQTGTLQYHTPTSSPEPIRHMPLLSVREPKIVPEGNLGMEQVFSDQGLLICNKGTHGETWGKKYYPTHCWVEGEESEGDDGDRHGFPVDLLWLGVTTFTLHSVIMRERATSETVSGGNTLNNLFASYTWTTDMPDHSWDLIAPPGITHVTEPPLNPGRSDVFGEQPWCDIDVDGTFSITNLWSDLPKPAFPPPTNDPVATVKLVGQGRGIGFTLEPLPFNTSFGWPGGIDECKQDGIDSVFQTGGFSIGWSTKVWFRRTWNFELTCGLNGHPRTPIPGLTIPFIEDSITASGIPLPPCP